MSSGVLRAFIIALPLIAAVLDPPTEVMAMDSLKISSLAFDQNETIPSKFTCDGEDVSPSLHFDGVPANARSLALIVDDPDAPNGTWVHWVVWNIDPKTREVRVSSIPTGGVQGMNDFRKHDYGGPCPPSGTHRYFFKLYALDKMLELGPNTNKAHLEAAMHGHIIAHAELIGLYSRK